MELWIRSQNGEELIKVNGLYTNIPNDFGTGGFGVYTQSDLVKTSFLRLGIYKTKERALEVLDEIEEFIDLFQRNGFGNVLSDDGIHPKHTIYEMPKE